MSCFDQRLHEPANTTIGCCTKARLFCHKIVLRILAGSGRKAVESGWPVSQTASSWRIYYGIVAFEVGGAANVFDRHGDAKESAFSHFQGQKMNASQRRPQEPVGPFAPSAACGSRLRVCRAIDVTKKMQFPMLEGVCGDPRLGDPTKHDRV